MCVVRRLHENVILGAGQGSQVSLLRPCEVGSWCLCWQGAVVLWTGLILSEGTAYPGIDFH